LKTYGVDEANTGFPETVMNEIKNYESNTYFIIIDYTLPKEIINSRMDLRNELIFTIDPKKSKDLDDALSIKLINEEKKLYEVNY
jgi:exoribonuclease R